jgi:hypothetical protein
MQWKKFAAVAAVAALAFAGGWAVCAWRAPAAVQAAVKLIAATPQSCPVTTPQPAPVKSVRNHHARQRHHHRRHARAVECVVASGAA